MIDYKILKNIVRKTYYNLGIFEHPTLQLQSVEAVSVNDVDMIEAIFIEEYHIIRSPRRQIKIHLNCRELQFKKTMTEELIRYLKEQLIKSLEEKI